MKRIFWLIWVLYFNYNGSAQSVSEIEKKILSKNYRLKFSIKRTILNIPDKSSSEIIDGSIFRNNGYIYSETELIKGIYEDTLGLLIDEDFKMVNLFNNFSKSTILINPFYDPEEILNYALTHNNSKRKDINDGGLAYEFFFSDSFAIKKIQVSVDKDRNSFIIEFNYQRLNESIQDIINYKILPDTVMVDIPKISDYIEVRDGRYIKKPILAGYDFFNSTALEALLKEIENKKKRLD